MSDAKISFVEKANTVAKDVFHAQLGLAGKAFEQSQELVKVTEGKIKETEAKYKDLYAKRSEIFDGLVSRGEKVQSDAVAKFEESKEQVVSKLNQTKSDAVAKFESVKSEAVDARIKELRSSLESSLEKVKGLVQRNGDAAEAPAAESVAS